MGTKKVTDLIIDKLAEKIAVDSLFEDVSEDLTNMIKEKKYIKEEIEKLLKKRKNEDIGS